MTLAMNQLLMFKVRAKKIIKEITDCTWTLKSSENSPWPFLTDWFSTLQIAENKYLAIGCPGDQDITDVYEVTFTDDKNITSRKLSSITDLGLIRPKLMKWGNKFFVYGGFSYSTIASKVLTSNVFLGEFINNDIQWIKSTDLPTNWLISGDQSYLAKNSFIEIDQTKIISVKINSKSVLIGTLNIEDNSILWEENENGKPDSLNIDGLVSDAIKKDNYIYICANKFVTVYEYDNDLNTLIKKQQKTMEAYASYKIWINKLFKDKNDEIYSLQTDALVKITYNNETNELTFETMNKIHDYFSYINCSALGNIINNRYILLELIINNENNSQGISGTTPSRVNEIVILDTLNNAIESLAWGWNPSKEYMYTKTNASPNSFYGLTNDTPVKLNNNYYLVHKYFANANYWNYFCLCKKDNDIWRINWFRKSKSSGSNISNRMFPLPNNVFYSNSNYENYMLGKCLDDGTIQIINDTGERLFVEEGLSSDWFAAYNSFRKRNEDGSIWFKIWDATSSTKGYFKTLKIDIDSDNNVVWKSFMSTPELSFCQTSALEIINNSNLLWIGKVYENNGTLKSDEVWLGTINDNEYSISWERIGNLNESANTQITLTRIGENKFICRSIKDKEWKAVVIEIDINNKVISEKELPTVFVYPYIINSSSVYPLNEKISDNEINYNIFNYGDSKYKEYSPTITLKLK